MASFKHTFTSGQTVTPARLNDARDVFDIVDADIKSDAAIAGTKIAPNFGSSTIETTGSLEVYQNSGTDGAVVGSLNTANRGLWVWRGNIVSGGGINVGQQVSSSTPPAFTFYKSRGGNTATPTVVSSGDGVGQVAFKGYDGASWIDAAAIDCGVDGTPGTNDMPGRLIFSTTADGASSPTERMRIQADGKVGIGTSSPATLLHVDGITTATSYRVGTNQVVAARRLGWETPTGVNKRTTYSTATVTLEQLAQVVKALIIDLEAHGLIGPTV